MRALLWIATYSAAWLLILGWLNTPAWLLLALYPAACPVLYYVSTPICTGLRLWRYLSASLLVYRPWPRGPLTLHLGTSYDVVWRLLPHRKRGESAVRLVHREIYRGLASLCSEVKAGKVPAHTEVTTCSYFLSQRRMTECGFREGRAPALTRLNFVFAYTEVLLQQWLIGGRLCFFDPLRVRFFRTTAGELAQREALFRRLSDPCAGSSKSVKDTSCS